MHIPPGWVDFVRQGMRKEIMEEIKMDNFTKAYEIYFSKVHRFLLSLSGSEHMANELTQEVFYKALLHIEKYQDKGSMFTWLCTIGKNAWLNECRNQKRFTPIEDQYSLIQDTSSKPEDIILKREQQKLLRTAILELPEDYRDVVILHIYGEIPLREIAALKGKSDSWGKVTYYRAKHLLATNRLPPAESPTIITYPHNGNLAAHAITSSIP